jgi:uncharacterized protein YndB with AHSA1/START domain
MRVSVQLEGPVIKRSIEDVFAFAGNPENSPLWGRTINNVQDSDGPVSVGTVFRGETRIIGVKVKHQSEVTESDPPTKLFYTSLFENGVTEKARLTFETVDDGTRMNLTAEIGIERVPQVLGPFFSLLVQQRWRSLLKKLKDALESPDRSLVGAGILIAFGAIFLMTAGMRYLIEIFPQGGLWTALALLASSLVSAGVAGIVWRATRTRAIAEGDAPDPLLSP